MGDPDRKKCQQINSGPRSVIQQNRQRHQPERRVEPETIPPRTLHPRSLVGRKGFGAGGEEGKAGHKFRASGAVSMMIAKLRIRRKAVVSLRLAVVANVMGKVQ